MPKTKWNLTDVAEFLNFHYDNLVEWIQTSFIDDDRSGMGYKLACEIADEMCDKMAHIGEIQSISQANSDEAKEVVNDMLGENA